MFTHFGMKPSSYYFQHGSADHISLFITLPESTYRSCDHGYSVFLLPNVFPQPEPILGAVSGADQDTFTPAATATQSRP